MGLIVLVGGWPGSLLLVFFGLIVYGIIRLRAEHVMNRVWWTGSTRMEEEAILLRQGYGGQAHLRARLRRAGKEGGHNRRL
jgi:hypothetical protein